MAEEGSVNDNLEKGRGIVDGFKPVGLGSKDKDHPEVTGRDPMAKTRGRPPKEQRFTQVGKTAEEENRDPPTTQPKK